VHDSSCVRSGPAAGTLRGGREGLQGRTGPCWSGWLGPLAPLARGLRAADEVKPNLEESGFSENGCSWDIQDPPGQRPVQPAVGDPASAGGLD